MKFTVDRATWFRGKGGEASALLRTDGTRCCIGFVGQQCGIPDRNMLEAGGVGDIPKEPWPAGFLGPLLTTSGWVRRAYSINDRPPMNDADREIALAALFAANGHEIEFTGEGNPAKAVQS